MFDKHLNLFYSYNHDSELIENNLTRAWIVSLQLLSRETRSRFLHTLLDHHLSSIVPTPVIEKWNFAAADFTLQGFMDKKRAASCVEKFILAIASFRYAGLAEADGADINAPLPSREETGSSIPDAWFVDPTNQYCFLVESKVGFNPVDDNQVIYHARDWLGFKTQLLIRKRVIGLSWSHVAEAATQTQMTALEHEQSLLGHLIDYLGYFGYHVFKGLKLDDLPPQPAFTIGGRPLTGLYHFDRLLAPPHFRISSTISNLVKE